MEIPACLAQLTLLQNVENLKPYHPHPPEIGPTHKAPPQELVDGEEKFEVEDIITHRLVGHHKLLEYLVWFKGNLEHMLLRSSEPTRPYRQTTSPGRPDLTKPNKPSVPSGASQNPPSPGAQDTDRFLEQAVDF